jgi:Mg2+-importing ATPase
LVFDYLTFGALLWISGARPTAFRTGWFVESVLSAASVVLVVRSKRRLGESQPGRTLLRATALCMAATVLLPFTPLASLLGLEPPPANILLLIGGIVVAYVLTAELLKRRFYAAAARGTPVEVTRPAQNLRGPV